jgi:hypothetical protein
LEQSAESGSAQLSAAVAYPAALRVTLTIIGLIVTGILIVHLAGGGLGRL